MADISEAEAILHLKRALGEIDAGDAVPPPLPPVVQKPTPPPAKVQKQMPTQVPKSVPPSAPPVQPSIGPTPRNETRPPSQQQSAPAPPPQQRQQMRPSGPQARPPGMVQQGQPGGLAANPAALNSFLSQSIESQKESARPAGLAGLAAMQSLKGMSAGGGGTLPGQLPAGLAGLQPPGGGAPRPAPSQAPPGGGAAAAAAAAAAAGPGKSQGHFDIPQSKVGLVVGKGAATLNAIKAYSKAQCFVEQRTPDDEKARIFAVGSPPEIEKCKQTVLAVVDGSMSVATLFTLAGVSMPRGGVEEWEPPAPGRGGATAAPPSFMASPHGGMFPGPPLTAAGAPPLPPMMMAGLAATAPPVMGNIPGMPENQQMQQNLNDYYARWWSTYATQQQKDLLGGGQGNDQQQGGGSAFDKEALQRLAERAAQGLEEPSPPPSYPMYSPEPSYPPPPETDVPPGPPPESPKMASCGCGQQYAPSARFCSNCGLAVHKASDLIERASNEVRALLGGTSPSTAAGGGTAGAASPSQTWRPTRSDMPEGTGMSASSAVSSGATPGTAMPRGPITLKGFLRPAEPPKPKKDDDSVQKMMERLQGNVHQTKQALAMSEATPQTRQMNPRGPVGLGMLVGDEDPRTRADFEFEALVSRMQAAQSVDDVEHIGREVLIRFPSFTPQQVTDLLQKMDGATALQSYQNGDFLAELCRMVLPRLKEFTSTQFTSLTSTLASWSRTPDRKRSGRFSEFSKAFFNAASVEMSSRLMTFAPHELNCCLAAFVSVGFSEHKFFASVGRAALARHSSFAPVQLTALLAILSEMRLVHSDLFNAAAAFLSTRSKELRPVDIIRVLRSFAKCSVQHPGLCKAVCDEVVNRSRDKSTAASFKAEDLCEIAWALCVLSHYHEGLFRLMFKALEKAPMIASDSLLQLYECHLVLDSEQKDAYEAYKPESHLVDALEDHYKENRKDERRCSERQRNDVASVLKSLVDGSVHVNHRTSSGLLVDVAALRKRSSTDGFIHVDLDSNITVVRSLDQDEPTSAALVVEGPVALRRRLLTKSGLRLVTVREAEWRDLDDSKDKRRYLRSLLSNLGDVLQ